ncbi:MAG: phospholipid carrier-dependent glycosyltransferase [Blastochloris sp.]|nr:phospholipid carrier-dependent glycosyltransferase [Blastochloris sp.]
MTARLPVLPPCGSGSAGILLRRALLEWGLVDSMPFPLLLALMRLPAVLVHTAGILLGYHLLRRILPAGVAMLAALLWAADPFVIAYARILHVDGLTTTFATLSLLAALVYYNHRGAIGYLVLSAVCGALAVLSKSPGLAVVPVISLAALLAAWEQTVSQRHTTTKYRSFALCVLRSSFIWGGVFALSIVLVYPAMWADPLRVYEQMRVGVEVEGGSPHVIGNFFLGEENDTPGPLYYPAALALRTTPITLVGLFLLAFVWRWNGLDTAQRRTLALLALYSILFVAAMSLFPKKLNRYSVPVFPALDVLAAVGMVGVVNAQRTAQTIVSARTARRVPLAASLVAALAVANVIWWHPYSVVAFNQLLGGAPTAARTFLMGDGEGLAEAARWLNQQPDITGVRVASTMINSLQPFLKHGAQSVSPDESGLEPQDGYVLIYIRHVQRGEPRPPFDAFYGDQPPLYKVRLHGVDYVWVYQVPPPMAQPLDVAFGEAIQLRGYIVDTAAIRSDGTLALTAQWQASTPLAQDYLFFVHLLDSSGQRIGQIDVPPLAPTAPPQHGSLASI